MSGDQNRFGKYRLLQRIGTGGMGEVHLAKLIGPSGFEKLVVIKRLLEARQNEKKYIDMFFREANVAAQLNHSNIVQIYEVGVHEGVHYIAMEYVQGKSLRRVIDRCYEQNRRLPGAYVVQIIAELCAGLAFAHNARHLSGAPLGLIHRDINPHNVLISYRGEIKIIDFGIAKSDLTLDKTQAGTIKGTVVYMSPEQSSGQKLDKRSDQFAVGICLYEALTGNNPFHKDSLGGSLEAIRKVEVPPLNAEAQPFAKILDHALARSPDDRYPDCADLADALEELLDTGAVQRIHAPLSKFMTDMFADDIIDEERLLSQTELSQMPPMDGTSNTSSDMEQDRTLAEGGLSSAEPTLRQSSQPSFHTDVGGRGAFIPNILRNLWAMSTVRMGVGAALVIGGLFLLFLKARIPPGPDDVDNGVDATNSAPAAPQENPTVPTPPTPPPTPPVNVAPTPTPSSPTPTPPPTPVQTTPPEEGDGRRQPKHPGHKKSFKHPHPEPFVPSEAPAASSLQIFLDPPARVLNNGASEGRNIRLRTTSGVLQIGSQGDGYVIKVRYRVENKSITYTVESEPWANVSGAGGIALGRTPLNGVSGDGTTVFEFSNPNLSNSQRITLRFNP